MFPQKNHPSKHLQQGEFSLLLTCFGIFRPTRLCPNVAAQMDAGFGSTIAVVNAPGQLLVALNHFGGGTISKFAKILESSLPCYL